MFYGSQKTSCLSNKIVTANLDAATIDDIGHHQSMLDAMCPGKVCQHVSKENFHRFFLKDIFYFIYCIYLSRHVFTLSTYALEVRSLH